MESIDQYQRVPRDEVQHATWNGNSPSTENQEYKPQRNTMLTETSYVASKYDKEFRPLPRELRTSGWDYIPEILGLLASLLFIILGFCILGLHGKSAVSTAWAHNVIEATKLAPTLWPIFFAAILGNTMLVLATWKSERGASLGDVEQLVGSQTFVSTIRSFLGLRRCRLYMIALLFCWAFSPLGSQAALRCLTTELRSSVTQSLVTYSNLNFGFLTNNYYADAWETVGFLITSVYRSSIMARQSGLQYSNGSSANFTSAFSRLGTPSDVLESITSDLWGNVLVPKLELLPAFNPEKSNEWIEVPYTSQVVNYSSLVGIPLREYVDGEQVLRSSGNLTVTMNASYLNLKCDDWTGLNKSNSSWTNWMEMNYKSMTLKYNATLDHQPYNFDNFSNWFPYSGFGIMLDIVAPLQSDSADLPNSSNHTDIVGANRLMFGSTEGTMVWITTCAMQTTFIVVNTTCPSTDTSRLPCAVEKMKIDDNPPWSTNRTLFNNKDQAQLFATNFPVASNDLTLHPGEPTVTEFYLLNPPQAVEGIDIGFFEDSFDLGNVPMPIFQERLALTMNTFWQASISPTTITGENIGDVSLDDAGAANTTADHVLPLDSVYGIDSKWMVIYFISSFILLGAAIVGLVFRALCRGPSIFGYANTSMRYSRYFPDSTQYNTTLNGADKAREVAGIRVRLGDIRAESEVGYIALAEEAFVARLVRGRRYG